MNKNIYELLNAKHENWFFKKVFTAVFTFKYLETISMKILHNSKIWLTGRNSSQKIDISHIA